MKEEEVMCPTMERWLVLHWMQLIHPGLPASVQPQICDAIPGFLAELNNDDIKASRAYVQRPQHKSYERTNTSRKSHNGGRMQQKPPTHAPKKTCRICHAEGRKYIGHTLMECDCLYCCKTWSCNNQAVFS